MEKRLAYGENEAGNRLKNIHNDRKPVFWLKIVLMIVLVLAVFALLVNCLANLGPDDLSTTDGFKKALNRQLGSIIDITGQEKQKYPKSITENQRILKYQEEFIFVEVAVDRPVEEIVKKRMDDINNPLIDRRWPVHLYVKDDLIVEYSGKNETLINALVKLLGAELPHDIPPS